MWHPGTPHSEEQWHGDHRPSCPGAPGFISVHFISVHSLCLPFTDVRTPDVPAPRAFVLAPSSCQNKLVASGGLSPLRSSVPWPPSQ